MFHWDSGTCTPCKNGFSLVIVPEPNLIVAVNFEHVMPPAAASQRYRKLLALTKHTDAAAAQDVERDSQITGLFRNN
jgi:hypothetical protein